MKSNNIKINLILVLSLCLLMAGMFTMGCTGDAAGTGEQETPVSSLVKEMNGIDVSHYSGTVDWTKVKEGGYVFAFAKATEGMDDNDPMFAAHWPAMKKAGILRGAYHFYVTEDDPPVFLIHGEDDVTVPVEQSYAYYEALQETGVRCELLVVKNAGHGLRKMGGIESEPSRDEAIETAIDFLDEVL